jgi:hypothetical protein
MLFMVFVFAIGFGFVVLALLRISRGNGPGDDGHGDDGPPWRRGWGPWRPRPRGPEPAWWPEFERDFRAYASSHAARRKVSGVS